MQFIQKLWDILGVKLCNITDKKKNVKRKMINIQGNTFLKKRCIIELYSLYVKIQIFCIESKQHKKPIK